MKQKCMFYLTGITTFELYEHGKTISLCNTQPRQNRSGRDIEKGRPTRTTNVTQYEKTVHWQKYIFKTRYKLIMSS